MRKDKKYREKMARKKAERKVWVDAHREPSARIKGLVAMYKLTDVPQYQWILEQGKRLEVKKPVNWIDSTSALKEYARDIVRAQGLGKHSNRKKVQMRRRKEGLRPIRIPYTTMKKRPRSTETI